MHDARHVVIVSANPVVAAGLSAWLEQASQGFHPHWTGSMDPAERLAVPAEALLLVAPQNWRELACWLPGLRKHASDRRWLFFGDLRIAGMFASEIDAACCTLVAASESPERLRVSLWVLAEG